MTPSDTPKYTFAKRRNYKRDCPCGEHNNKDGKFIHYEGFENYGFCHSCDKTFPPPREENQFNKPYAPRPKPSKPIEYSRYPNEAARNHLKSRTENNLYKYLVKRIGDVAEVDDLALKYGLCDSNHWPNTTMFWYVDEKKQVRSAKIMRYNPDNGKRIKDGPYFNWIHRVENIDGFKLEKCLFGLHLLKDDNNTIGIVESEKTAILCAYLLPKITWMATGGKSGLNASILKPIQGRKIILYPDLKAYNDWREKADLIRQELPLIDISTSTVLIDRYDVNGPNDYDLADVLRRSTSVLDDIITQYPLMNKMIEMFGIEKSDITIDSD
jgi:hypothetical protein